METWTSVTLISSASSVVLSDTVPSTAVLLHGLAYVAIGMAATLSTVVARLPRDVLLMSTILVPDFY